MLDKFSLSALWKCIKNKKRKNAYWCVGVQKFKGWDHFLRLSLFNPPLKVKCKVSSSVALEALMQPELLHQRHSSGLSESGLNTLHIWQLLALVLTSQHPQLLWVSACSWSVFLLFLHHPASQLVYQQEEKES